ncbi:hypothetical protein [Picrophilus oshimae]|uniref:Uncharacterized protein n=1 Tax=Picrophilus torridus (strain ATCC 700027 / DSM 9790 / JCM 10055 / NBRC 100828 / KAW 2/3) TaxID=1122961 RepID=A0A8G2FXT3_PICTO|nr:hypothetical protein [Picrophilus oshimae]SMD31476.1 hypothetical protein SAMN02745355_1419 [Picrophilus oshimae DSM 9789]
MEDIKNIRESILERFSMIDPFMDSCYTVPGSSNIKGNLEIEDAEIDPENIFVIDKNYVITRSMEPPVIYVDYSYIGPETIYDENPEEVLKRYDVLRDYRDPAVIHFLPFNCKKSVFKRLFSSTELNGILTLEDAERMVLNDYFLRILSMFSYEKIITDDDDIKRLLMDNVNLEFID